MIIWRDSVELSALYCRLRSVLGSYRTKDYLYFENFCEIYIFYPWNVSKILLSLAASKQGVKKICTAFSLPSWLKASESTSRTHKTPKTISLQKWTRCHGISVALLFLCDRAEVAIPFPFGIWFLKLCEQVDTGLSVESDEWRYEELCCLFFVFIIKILFL